MKLKLDDKGAVVVQDGKPVYIPTTGKRSPSTSRAPQATISRFNGEAKSHRERAEAAEGKLKTFEGISDPEAARKALNTVANLDAKKLVDAGEVEKVKAEAVKAVEEKYAPVVEARGNAGRPAQLALDRRRVRPLQVHRRQVRSPRPGRCRDRASALRPAVQGRGRQARRARRAGQQALFALAPRRTGRLPTRRSSSWWTPTRTRPRSSRARALRAVVQLAVRRWWREEDLHPCAVRCPRPAAKRAASQEVGKGAAVITD
jgi:hypothetical protein